MSTGQKIYIGVLATALVLAVASMIDFEAFMIGSRQTFVMIGLASQPDRYEPDWFDKARSLSAVVGHLCTLAVLTVFVMTSLVMIVGAHMLAWDALKGEKCDESLPKNITPTE